MMVMTVQGVRGLCRLPHHSGVPAMTTEHIWTVQDKVADFYGGISCHMASVLMGRETLGPETCPQVEKSFTRRENKHLHTERRASVKTALPTA